MSLRVQLLLLCAVAMAPFFTADHPAVAGSTSSPFAGNYADGIWYSDWTISIATTGAIRGDYRNGDGDLHGKVEDDGAMIVSAKWVWEWEDGWVYPARDAQGAAPATGTLDAGHKTYKERFAYTDIGHVEFVDTVVGRSLLFVGTREWDTGYVEDVSYYWYRW